MTFYAIEFNTTEGGKLKAALESRLSDLRAQLESLNLDERATASIRGRIAEIRSLLSKAPGKVEPMPAYSRANVEPMPAYSRANTTGGAPS
jgi:uncharacterized protein YicC (UPF0701 family)